MAPSMPASILKNLLTPGATGAALIVLTDEQLLKFVQETVQFTLSQIHEQAPGKQRLTPSEVRQMARCSAQRVSDALNSGELPAEREETGQERRGRDGTLIPGYRWWILRPDADAFVQGIQEEHRSRGIKLTAKKEDKICQSRLAG